MSNPNAFRTPSGDPGLSSTPGENSNKERYRETGRRTYKAAIAQAQVAALHEIIDNPNQVHQAKIGPKTKTLLSSLAGVAIAGVVLFSAQPDEQANATPNTTPAVAEPEAGTDQDTITDSFSDNAVSDIDGEAYGFARNDEWELSSNSLTGYEMLDQAIDGSFSQYGNLGCYDNKTSEVNPYAVGDVAMVLREMGINPEEATPEQVGKVTQYLAYSMAEPAASIAVSMNFDGFAGLSQSEAENKIDNMSPEEKTALQTALKNYFDKTSYSFDIGNGVYKNQGIYEDENGDKYSKFGESDLTGQTILVASTPLEDGSTAVIVYKEDCGNIVIYVVINHPDGTITTVEIVQEDDYHSGISNDVKPQPGESFPEPAPPTVIERSDPTPTPPPPKPSPEPEPEPSPKPKPKPDPTPVPDQPPEEQIAAKDTENMERIDEQIKQDIANDTEGTERINVEPTTTVEEKEQPRTEQPVVNESPAIIERESEPESPPPVQVEAKEPDNDYSTNDNGAYTPNEDLEAQIIADQNATPVNDNSWQNDLDDILGGLGIEYNEGNNGE